MKNKHQKEDFQKLQNALRNLEMPEAKFRSDLKKKLMFSIKHDGLFETEDRVLINALTESAQATEISFERGKFVKHKLMARLTEKAARTWTELFAYVAKIFSMSAPVLAGLALFIYALQFEAVVFDSFAAKATVLKDLRGEVYVLRDGQKLLAYENMTLQEKDIISTGSESAVAIRYLDDSISRLDKNSSLEVKKLFSHSKKSSLTVVELELIEGEVWNRVVNLLDDSGAQFKVKSANLETKAVSKSAFSVSKENDGKVEVKVVENEIAVQELPSPEKGESLAKRIPEGFAVVAEEPAKKLDLKVVAKENLLDEKENTWISANIAEDQEYLREVVAEKKDKRKQLIGSLPDESLYKIKTLKEDASLLLADDEIQMNELQLGIANRKFQEAQALLDKGELDLAKETLDDFRSDLKVYNDFVDAVEANNQDLAVDMRSRLLAVIEENQKDLALLDEEGSLTLAKETLNQVQSDLALVPEEKAADQFEEIELVKNAAESDTVQKTTQTVTPPKSRYPAKIQYLDVADSEVFAPGGGVLIEAGTSELTPEN